MSACSPVLRKSQDAFLGATDAVSKASGRYSGGGERLPGFHIDRKNQIPAATGVMASITTYVVEIQVGA